MKKKRPWVTTSMKVTPKQEVSPGKLKVTKALAQSSDGKTTYQLPQELRKTHLMARLSDDETRGQLMKIVWTDNGSLHVDGADDDWPVEDTDKPLKLRLPSWWERRRPANGLQVVAAIVVALAALAVAALSVLSGSAFHICAWVSIGLGVLAVILVAVSGLAN
jgi:hypothetical protein